MKKKTTAKGGAPKRKREKSSQTSLEPATAEPLAIVGIGASAGGLEALQKFFERTPQRCGVAFVVVHHRDPAQRGMLVEILQRSAKMPVSEAADGETVVANQVYVIPANRDLAIIHGKLRLFELAGPGHVHLPIDSFFRSLADDCRERAIGVILSGMGSDGTLGLRAIKEAAGAAFVQSPESAKFDTMPRSAIEGGLADVVAPPEELPARILAYVDRRTHHDVPDPVLAGQSTTLDRIFVLLRAITGNDFSQYKKSTLIRRIERRMGLHQIDGLDKYLRFLRENVKEAELLGKELLIGVTCFFRDGAAWERLEKEVLPGIVDARQGGVIRAWVAGCSTGEEAFSLAIILREAIEKAQPSHNVRVQIFATDLDRDAIEKARSGAYPANISADVTPERLRRFFVQEERGYRVSKEIREMVIFAPQNVIMDPPFTKLDILSCRNVLIYLSAEVQKKLIPLFHYSLNPNGVLFLGNAETIGGFSNLFAADDQKARIYRRIEPVDAPAIDFPATFSLSPQSDEREPERQQPKTQPNVQTLIEHMLLDRHAPPAVLTTDKGDILYVSGKTGKFLEPAAGKANWNVFAMAREGLRYDLSAAFARALRSDGPVVVRGVDVGTNGGRATVDVTVEKLRDPEAVRGRILVVFTDAPKAAKVPVGKTTARASRVLTEMRDELRRSRQEAQSLREHMQTSEEELKSSNEELQSTNEELQSTNEELTTSKEELQSLNEELQTVNHELQSKLDELSRSNNDMTNLLNSTDIATLFLDGQLRVRRFTTRTAKLIKLIPGDAGRPVTDMASELDYPELADDAREVLRTLAFRERLVTARGGQWYAVRILPYRTIENVIDGVVITFSDASAQKKLEASLREQTSQLKQLAESLPNLVFGCQANGTCDYLNAQWLQYTGIGEAQQLGHRWLEQIDDQDRSRVRREWGDAVQNGKMLDTEARIRSAEKVSRWFKIRAVPILAENGGVARWYGSCTDVDDLKRAAQDVRG